MAPGGTLAGAFGRPVTIQRKVTNRWNSDVSTVDTIRILRRLARQYATDPYVEYAVAEATSRLGANVSDRQIACALFYWVRQTVSFVEDETLLYEELGVAPENLDKELLIVPPLLLQMPQPMGDCDDFSLLLAAMALAADLRAYYITVAADASDPQKFSHIYVCVELADEGSHLCLDAGNRYQAVPPGWEECTHIHRKAIWRI
jgi:transglutaminase-like putative cysteine protease